MTSILWVQTKTETGSDDIVRDCKKGGQADFDELLLYKKESQWNQLAVEPYKIKKTEDAFLVQGHLEDVDYSNSKLPFEFLCFSKNLFEVLDSLKKSLATLNYHVDDGGMKMALNQVNASCAVPCSSGIVVRIKKRLQNRLAIMAGTGGVLVAVALFLFRLIK